MRRLILFALLTMPLCNFAFAGTADTELSGAAARVSGWLGGYLAMTLAGVALLLGIAISAVTGKLIPATIGFGVAVFASFAPTIISGSIPSLAGWIYGPGTVHGLLSAVM